MAIDPLNGLPPSSVDNRRADAATRGDAVASSKQHKGGNGPEDTDTLSLSDAVAALPAADAVPTGTLTADQLQAIAQKLATGAYNSPESIDRLADQFITNPGLLNGQG